MWLIYRNILCRAVLVLCAGTGTLWAQSAPVPLVIEHVTVIDTRSGALAPDTTVVIEGKRIKAVQHGKTGSWAGATVVNGRGKFLIPGLWDMEVHLSWSKETSLPLLVANGVTGARDLGGDFAEIVAWKTRIAADILLGPHVLQVGPMLNGKSFNRYQLATGDPDQARAIARTLKFLGVDGLEVERKVAKDSYEALLDQAKQDHLPLTGHVPMAVSPEAASVGGQASIENVESLYYGTFAKGIEDAQLAGAIDKFLSSEASNRLFRIFADNHTAVTPVLSALDSILQQASPATGVDPESRYVPLPYGNRL